MAEITVPAKKFLQLLDYLRHIELDADGLAAQVNLQSARLARLNPDHPLPASQYSRLYKVSVEALQELQRPLPWGAGIGSEAFELMCHCIISTRTLGEALRLAQRFEKLIYPMVRYNMRLLDDGGDIVKLSYRIHTEEETPLVPEQWDRAGFQQTVARASGLLVWHALCGWLTGRSMEAIELRIAAPAINREYHDSLARVFTCPIHFDAGENTFSFRRDTLQRRLVQTPESLQEFLGNAVYQLIAMEQKPASTSAAIKSLVIIDLPGSLPSFQRIAEHLHMSESSLRRRLQKECTSYQALKDEVRCEVAMDMLLNQGARVADIAEHLGFTEPSSFVRSFKNWTGQTPRTYREQMHSLGPD